MKRIFIVILLVNVLLNNVLFAVKILYCFIARVLINTILRLEILLLAQKLLHVVYVIKVGLLVLLQPKYMIIR